MSIEKGIILAGGLGTRLSPITKFLNKQLIPLYDKPLIYYPLSLLMLIKVKKILIIINKESAESYKKLLGNGSRLGIKIEYQIQEKPNGIPEAITIGKNFINKSNFILLLGDNFFYGQGLIKRLLKIKKKNCATVFFYPVNNPGEFGIINFNKAKRIQNIIEKPKKSKSNNAITGLYFFDNKAVNYAIQLKPSKRNETEIIDLLKIYLKNKKLNAEPVGRGGAWLDTGTFDGLQNASQFVQSIEKRQGLKIACLEEISLNNKWINNKDIKDSINFYGNCDYSKYLKKLII